MLLNMSESFQAIMSKPKFTFLIKGHWWGLKQDLISTNHKDARSWSLETRATPTSCQGLSSGSGRGDCVFAYVLVFLNAAFSLTAGETEACLSL